MIVWDQVHVVWRSRQLLVVHPKSEDVQRGAMHRSTSARVNFSMSMSTCAAKTFKFLNVNVNPPTSQTDQLSDLPWKNCTGLDHDNLTNLSCSVSTFGCCFSAVDFTPELGCFGDFVHCLWEVILTRMCCFTDIICTSIFFSSSFFF